MSLDERFDTAAENVSKKINQTLSNDELKEVYALFKQGTVGDINTSRPGMLDLKGKAKWDAWNSKKGLAKDEAKEQYIALIGQLLEKHGLRKENVGISCIEAKKMAPPKPTVDPRIKTIKIKTGVLKRVGKEKLSYRKEADQQKLKIEKMKEDGKDIHDVRKMGEVLQETLMMIPDCHRRIKAAKEELLSILETEAELRMTEKGEVCEEFTDAEAQIVEAIEQLKVE